MNRYPLLIGMGLLAPGVIASCGVSDLTVTGSGDAGAGGVSGHSAGSAGSKAHGASGGTTATSGGAGEIGDSGAANGGSGVAHGGSSVASGGTGVTSGGTGVTSGGTGVTSGGTGTTSKGGAGSGGACDLKCDGTCFDSQSSNTNCGSCGHACTSDQACRSGFCTCNTAGLVICSKSIQCIDTNTSSANCGTCDNKCGTGLVCSGGTCKVPPVCDVLAAAGNPCVAAHSTTRLMVSGYTGPLYQVCLGSYVPGPGSCTGTTKDIGSIGGVADSAAQDAFCGTGVCTISIIYDQTKNKNDLEPAPKGGANGNAENPASATALKTTLAGHAVYGVLIQKQQAGTPVIPGSGYRHMIGVGTATGDQPESEYMVTSQKDLVNGCCFEYGNAETSGKDDGAGTAEAVYFGGGVIWGTGFGGKPGPWVEADLENGLYAGWENGQDQNISTNVAQKYDFVTAMLVGDTADKNGGQGRFALYAGEASGGVGTMYDGIRPNGTQPYVPMRKEGGIILGIGGDNSNAGAGRWYEGVMSTGAWTSATVDDVSYNIALAGYGK